MSTIDNNASYAEQLRNLRETAYAIVAQYANPKLFKGIESDQDTPQGRIEFLNKKRISTMNWVELANKILGKQAANASPESQQMLANKKRELEQKAKFWSTVDVAKYQAANPDPLKDIPSRITLDLGKAKLLGTGAQGRVYAAKIPTLRNQEQEIAIKTGIVKNELIIGKT
jgi:hypothetical protein